LFCGFLVLITSQTTTMDGFTRRWVDVTWTAAPPFFDRMAFRWIKNRWLGVTWTAVPAIDKRPTDSVKYIYFGVLVTLTFFGLIVIWLTNKPGMVFKVATTGYNFAFAFSAWHTLFVNTILLPKELRPGWPQRIGLVLAGMFFLTLGIMAALKLAGVIT
jgi:hypothetical protein